jgi:hypothetical protein
MQDFPYQHQANVTDLQFLEHLNLPASAGSRLRNAMARGDRSEACHLVAEHYRSRAAPAWSFWSHGTPWHQTDAVGNVLEKAQRLLGDCFRNSWPPHQWVELRSKGGDVDWPKGLAAASTSISRGTWITELSTVFAITGDRRFAIKAVELVRSVVRSMPFVLDPRFEEDHDAYFGGPAGSTQNTSYRLFRLTDLLHSGVMHLPEVTDDDVLWLVKQIWFYSMQYTRLMGDELRRDNHHLLDHGHVPFVMGLAFPEFSGSREMVREGARVIRHHFGHNLLKDGAYAEHSADYQYHVLFHYTHPHGLAKANGYKLFTATQVRRLRKWVEFSARCAKPNGVLPAIGDEPGRPLLHLFGSLATPIMDRSLAAMARGVGCIPGTHKYATAADVGRAMRSWGKSRADSGDDDRTRSMKPTGPQIGLSEYYTTQAKRPDPRLLPTPATCQYPYGGYTFFRSHWSADADYLAVSHFSGDYGGHAHWDMMSFILHTRGKTLIGDPAAWLYVDRRFHGHGGDHRQPVAQQPLPFRGYSYSVNAHNCLVINDDTLKPLEAMNHGTFWGGWPPKHSLGVFEAGGPIEVAEVWNDANYPTRHRRFFVHVVGLGFVLVDLMSKRPNLAPHQYTQHFHFEGDVQLAVPADGSSIRATDGDAACLIVPGAETTFRWDTRRDLYLDDVYGVPNSRGAPWIAELTRRIRGQAVFTHFILTREAALLPGARCEYLGGKPAAWLDWQRDGISANRLDLGRQGVLFVASAAYGKAVQSEELATDAELAVAHLDARNKVRAWMVIRGGFLKLQGRQLLSGRRRESVKSR